MIYVNPPKTIWIPADQTPCASYPLLSSSIMFDVLNNCMMCIGGWEGQGCLWFVSNRTLDIIYNSLYDPSESWQSIGEETLKSNFCEKFVHGMVNLGRKREHHCTTKASEETAHGRHRRPGKGITPPPYSFSYRFSGPSCWFELEFRT